MVHHRFNNDTKGFEAFKVWVFLQAQKLLPNACPSCIFFGIEHTGVYTLPLCLFLTEQELAYALYSGLEMGYSMGIRRGKNDKLDSKKIARYLFLHQFELVVAPQPSDTLMTIKNLLSYQNRLKRYRHGLKVSAKELEAFACDIHHKHVTTHSKELVDLMEKKIKAVKEDIISLIQADEDLLKLYELVTSVKGIGFEIGTHLIVFTNRFTAFKKVRPFACYIGIAPFDYLSGSSVRKATAVSKKGHKRIKALLSNGVQSAILNDKEINAYFERKSKGLNKKQYGKIYNAIKFKLLARVFAVVKRGTPYVPLNQYKA